MERDTSRTRQPVVGSMKEAVIAGFVKLELKTDQPDVSGPEEAQIALAEMRPQLLEDIGEARTL